MSSATPSPDVLRGLLDEPHDGPILRPARIEAGRRRAAGEAIAADELVAALVAEGPPLLQHGEPAQQ